MQDKNKVSEVIKANAGWTEEDRDFLTEINDAEFVKIHANVFSSKKDDDEEDEEEEAKKANRKIGRKKNTKKTNEEDEEDEEEDEDEDELKKTNKKKAPKVNTAEEYIAAAPQGIREVLQAGVATYNAQKSDTIKALTETKRCKFSEKQLNAMTLKDLSALAELANIEPDFSLQAGALQANEDDNEVPPMPEMTFTS
jgi:nitric oxide reductase activation protein